MKLAAVFVGTMILIVPMDGVSPMQMSPSATNRSFRQIEQPWPIKIGILAGGIILIGSEFWWFLGRK